MMKPKNSLKIPLKVTNTLTNSPGRTFPNPIPNVMAMIIRANKPIFNLFMIMCYCSNCKDRIIEQITYQIVKYKKNNLWKRQI